MGIARALCGLGNGLAAGFNVALEAPTETLCNDLVKTDVQVGCRIYLRWKGKCARN